MLMPRVAQAENFFEMLFGGPQQQQKPQKQPRPAEQSPVANFFADPFGLNAQQQAPPPRPAASAGASSGPAFCVRSCDGKYFPLMVRGGMSAAQMCQAFCPATATKVYFGGNIDTASAGGERYADSGNAFAYRKALKPDCTCNGRDPAGLAPVDLSLDGSLKAGDVIATTSGLVAYSGARLGLNQTPDFTPVASFPGLTSDIRAKLGEMKVAPVSADTLDSEDAQAAVPAPAPAPVPVAQKPATPKAKRAELR